ncbi:kinase-like domain-containing protein [Kickxella alabastrina]|uniref:kinase-like domain-containing protein n=1 Tax=Kickxella alabastrina TaxID=61397 RepID=UPI002220B3F1|nr:kinase-like domain-containing protein [Kickxella alabastrina]KAI7830052.1 kinase-like domain-containing protein [Kickxella alabastrina]KAJ1938761.1 hypothetical protein GGF37_004681 [Kickxella alabastrina]
MTNTSEFTNASQDTAALVDAIPHFAFDVKHDSLFDDSKLLLTKVFPEWSADELTFNQCKDGITNKLIQCTNKSKDITVLIRAYGKHTEVIIDRSQELINMAGLTRLGMCPPLYARFNNGLVYGFIPGTVAKPEEMGNDLWAPLIARKLAEWGQVQLPGDHSPQLFPIIRRWMNDIPANYASERDNAIFHKHFKIQDLIAECDQLDAILTKLDSPVVFSHNDLLSGNVIMAESKDEVFFIDYEYAMYNYRGFDIANHFNEYAGFECDYGRYPGKEAQLAWFKTYLDHIALDSGSGALEAMYTEVSLFQLASHFYWGIWALVQADISDIDFDYMDYARLRFEQYYRVKTRVLV